MITSAALQFATRHKAILILLLLAHVDCAAGDAPDPLLPAWRETGRSLFRDAHSRFAHAAGREARLGEAATLLQLQPKTEGNIRAAHALLAKMIETSPVDDDTGLAALYLLARIEHIHRSVPDHSAAAVHYRRLIDLRPGHPLASQAAAKLALIELYAQCPPEERGRRMAAFAELARSLPDASAQRDLHLILGEVALRFELGAEQALEHFRAAQKAGILRPPLRADTLIRVGELARALGRAELARENYLAFLAEFPRDNRRLLVREALATLPDPDPA